jgi:hypothetical protein
MGGRARIGSARRTPRDGQGLGAPHPDGAPLDPGLAVGADRRKAFEQRGQRGRDLGPGERMAEAVVGPRAEGEMGRAAVEPQPVGLVVDGGIAIGGTVDERGETAGGQLRSVLQ